MRKHLAPRRRITIFFYKRNQNFITLDVTEKKLLSVFQFTLIKIKYFIQWVITMLRDDVVNFYCNSHLFITRCNNGSPKSILYSLIDFTILII